MASNEHFVNFPSSGIPLWLNRCFAPRHPQNRTTGAKLGNHSQQLTANYALFDMPFDTKLLHLASREPVGLGQLTLNRVNGLWSFLKPCLQASIGSLSRGLKIARLYKQNASCRVILLAGTELRPVSFNKCRQNEEAFLQKYSWYAHVSPLFPSLPYGKYCFHWKNWQSGNFSENPSMRAVTKILRARASEHSSYFCE